MTTTTSNNKTYYLYRHIRLDTNEVFYVGVGSKYREIVYKKHETEFKRAFSQNDRGNWWKRITNKTEYRVEILLESENINFIKEKEIEFIKLYGRRDLGFGTLTNLTDGGDGIKNVSESTRDKLRNNRLGKKWSLQTRQRKLSSDDYTTRYKKVYQYDKNGNFIKEWEAIKIAAEFYKIDSGRISKACRGERQTTAKYQWRYNFLGDKIDKVKSPTSFIHLKFRNTEVYQIDKKTGQILKEFKTIKEAALAVGGSSGNISACCRGRKLSIYGFKWEYKN